MKKFPSAKEIFNETLKNQPNADVNQLHSSTYSLMKKYRDAYYHDKVKSFLRHSALSQLSIKNSKDLKNIIIQVNFKNNTTAVLSPFSAWENLAYIMEALGVTAEKCVREGINREKVSRAIRDYIEEVSGSYHL